jgi:predicted membrane protein
MSKRKFNSGNNDITAGIVILIIGGVLMLKALGIWFPSWVFTWPMILISVGVVSLVKNKYQSGFGVFMILFGSFFLVKKNFGFPIGLEPYLIPAGLILLGLYLIAKKQRNDKMFNEDFFKSYQKNINNPSDPNAGGMGTSSFRNGTFVETGDVLNAQALFTGIQKRVLSKNFRGGKTSAIFGGTEIDLSQADIADGAILNVEVAFGGVKLVVPPHWDLQINVSNIFAGIEDKRMYNPAATDTTKVLKIYGSIIFGGLEIKSF